MDSLIDLEQVDDRLSDSAVGVQDAVAAIRTAIQGRASFEPHDFRAVPA